MVIYLRKTSTAYVCCVLKHIVCILSSLCCTLIYPPGNQNAAIQVVGGLFNANIVRLHCHAGCSWIGYFSARQPFIWTKNIVILRSHETLRHMILSHAYHIRIHMRFLQFHSLCFKFCPSFVSLAVSWISRSWSSWILALQSQSLAVNRELQLKLAAYLQEVTIRLAGSLTRLKQALSLIPALFRQPFYAEVGTSVTNARIILTVGSFATEKLSTFAWC